MRPFDTFSNSDREKIRFVLTDIDDTLTVNGQLPSAALAALEKLQSANISVIPVTGRPAGWCDHIARMWPVDAVVGENGAFYFYYNRQKNKMVRSYWRTERQRLKDREKLTRLQQDIMEKVPGCGISADQSYREADLAIDYCEDVEPLPPSAIETIVKLFVQAGAQAKVSSIHVNGWFGSYDKLTMVKQLLGNKYQVSPQRMKEEVLYCGDSPNDEPMFAFFPHSVGVANVQQYVRHMTIPPVWVTQKKGGAGFAEMVTHLTR